MNEPTLLQMIGEAARLGGGDMCAAGHDWKSAGGRVCPRGDPMGGGRCSQTVYECARCPDVDYGEPGGPGYRDCYTLGPCDESCIPDENRWLCSCSEHNGANDKRCWACMRDRPAHPTSGDSNG